jgi:nitrogen fixation protein NifU and related proteins
MTLPRKTDAVSSAGSAGANGPGGGLGGGHRAPTGAPANRPLPYSDVIRQRWRQPRWRGALPEANAVAEDVNPLCGDRVRMMLRVDDGRIQTARFLGDSCAICTASADVLAERIEGRPRAAPGVETVDLLEALGADIRPSRMRCVTLPLSVLGKALGGSDAAR